MTKKVVLPVLTEPQKPSVEAARTRLGGTAQGLPLPPGLAPGVAVEFAEGVGVVLFASLVEVHVLVDPTRMRRLPPGDLAVVAVPEHLAALAADARLFGLLTAGQAVRYTGDTGALVDGTIIEKCRWGALVRREDAAVVAVGFRKLWPAPTGEAM